MIPLLVLITVLALVLGRNQPDRLLIVLTVLVAVLAIVMLYERTG